MLVHGALCFFRVPHWSNVVAIHNGDATRTLQFEHFDKFNDVLNALNDCSPREAMECFQTKELLLLLAMNLMIATSVPLSKVTMSV